jgi:uncharacterized alkaline shock family protein YloU
MEGNISNLWSNSGLLLSQGVLGKAVQTILEQESDMDDGMNEIENENDPVTVDRLHQSYNIIPNTTYEILIKVKVNMEKNTLLTEHSTNIEIQDTSANESTRQLSQEENNPFYDQSVSFHNHHHHLYCNSYCHHCYSCCCYQRGNRNDKFSKF